MLKIYRQMKTTIQLNFAKYNCDNRVDLIENKKSNELVPIKGI